MEPTMKAVVLAKPTPAEAVYLTSVPVPQAQPGWVLVRVKAFGMNHSEQILRLSEIDAPYIQKPIIPGIECVGEVAGPSDSGLAKDYFVLTTQCTIVSKRQGLTKSGYSTPRGITACFNAQNPAVRRRGTTRRRSSK